MDEKTKQLILDWILKNHEHHVGGCDDDECGCGCVDHEYPYVNSIELEKFINSLTKKRKINIIKK